MNRLCKHLLTQWTHVIQTQTKEGKETVPKKPSATAMDCRGGRYHFYGALLFITDEWFCLRRPIQSSDTETYETPFTNTPFAFQYRLKRSREDFFEILSFDVRCWESQKEFCFDNFSRLRLLNVWENRVSERLSCVLAYRDWSTCLCKASRY